MKNSDIHLRYAVGILLFLLTCSLAVNWSKIAGLSDIISLALSFASLVLAIIAIFQALFSGSNLTSSLAKIEEASSNIVKGSQSLLEKADAFPSGIAPLEAKMVEVAGLVSALNVQQKTESKVGRQKLEASKDIVPFATAGGNLALYMAVKAAGTGRLFRAEDIISDVPVVSSYCNGFIAALHSTGFSDMSMRDSRFEIRSVDDLKPEQIAEKAEKRGEAAQRLFAKHRPAIDAFFAAEVVEK
jgi:hypothetical protein